MTGLKSTISITWKTIRALVPILLLALPATAAPAPAGPGTAVLLRINGAIGPATSDYVGRGLDEAREKDARLVILQLDTPGGLDTAMRSIIRHIIASPVPVVAYVSPSGARAASAGTYILYASHVAAMAPATNLGAATPIQLGGLPGAEPGGGEQPDTNGNGNGNGKDKPAKKKAPETTGSTEQRKMVNDAVAYIRSLAEMRGRNADWAEQAVRQAASLSAKQALAHKVIDLIADDIPDLLEKIDGMKVEVNHSELVLHTRNLQIVHITPDWRNELLSVITNPNITYILMLLGIYGLFFELVNPGFVLPGVMGGISLLLALYAMQVLPVNFAGMGLMLLGIAFMIGEMFMPSFGVLGIGGVVAFIFGSIILFDTSGGNLSVSLPLILAVSFLTAGFFFIVIRVIYRSFHKPVVSGAEQMVGSTAEAQEDFSAEGLVFVHGELWRARSDSPVHKGEKMVVTGIDGLVLQIEPLKEKQP